MQTIQDITKRTGFSAIFERDIEPRRLELAEYLGTVKKIKVIYINTNKPEHIEGDLWCGCRKCCCLNGTCTHEE